MNGFQGWLPSWESKDFQGGSMEVSGTGIKVFAGWESKGNNIKDKVSRAGTQRFPRRVCEGFQGYFPGWESGRFPRRESRVEKQGGKVGGFQGWESKVGKQDEKAGWKQTIIRKCISA